MDICPKCGLPLQACVCEEIAKTEQRIQVTTEKKKFGKIVTIVRDHSIELQGDHTGNAKEVLAKLGFSEDAIEIA